jgi:hypothetical protein
VVFTTTSKNEILTDEIWICDSGSCRYYCNSDKCVSDVKEIDEKSTFGNSESMKATKVGSLKCHIVQLDRFSVNVKPKEIKYAIEFRVNLSSISKALKNGFNLSNQGLMISLKKGSVSVKLYRVIKTVNVSISVMKMITYGPSVAYIAKGNSTVIKEINVNKSHEMIGRSDRQNHES